MICAGKVFDLRVNHVAEISSMSRPFFSLRFFVSFSSSIIEKIRNRDENPASEG